MGYKTHLENTFNIGVIFILAFSIKVNSFAFSISSKPFSSKSFLISSYIPISKRKKKEHMSAINVFLSSY
jgi:hypothetical protein